MEKADLYICRPLEGLRVILLVQPAEFYNGAPPESYIEAAVQGLKGGRAGIPSGMRMEDFKVWIRDAKREKYPMRRSWELAVRIAQLEFGDGIVPKEIDWTTMVSLPK